MRVCFNPRSGARLKEWDFVLSHFPPSYVYLYGAGEEKIEAYHLIKDATRITTAADLPEVPLVVLSPPAARFLPGQIRLRDFKHPEDCVYLFGPDHDNLNEDHLGGREPASLVYIQTDTHYEMYAHTAAALTLYSRSLQRG
jgi:hypothetical protein